MTVVSTICKKSRRTQAERSAETQDKILAATLRCIDSLGLQNASTHEVGKEANVSRGALLHHYPSRHELLKAAFGKVLDEEVEMLAEFSRDLKPDGSSIRSVVEYIWSRYKGMLFSMTVDYLSLARVDTMTLTAAQTEATRFNEKLDDVWDACLSKVSISVEQRRVLMNQTQCFIRGMALQRIWRRDDVYFSEMLDDWITSLEERLAKR